MIVGEGVEALPRSGGRRPQTDPVAMMAPAAGQADDTGPHLVTDFERNFDSTGSGSHDDAILCLELETLRIDWMHQKAAAVFASHETWRIVHPGVVTAHLPTSDDLQRGRSARIAIPVGTQSTEIFQEDGWSQIDSTVRGPQLPGKTGL